MSNCNQKQKQRQQAIARQHHTTQWKMARGSTTNDPKLEANSAIVQSLTIPPIIKPKKHPSEERMRQRGAKRHENELLY